MPTRLGTSAAAAAITVYVVVPELAWGFFTLVNARHVYCLPCHAGGNVLQKQGKVFLAYSILSP